MAIVYRDIGATAFATSAATTLSAVVPSTAKAGDFLVFALSLSSVGTGNQTLGITSGWTLQLQAPPKTANSALAAVFTKVAVTSDIGATVTVTWTTSITASAAIAAYSGVDAVNPINLIARNNDTGTAASTLSGFVDPMNDTVVGVSVNQGGITSGYVAANGSGFTPNFRVQNANYSALTVSDYSIPIGVYTLSSSNTSYVNTFIAMALNPAQGIQKRSYTTTADTNSTTWSVGLGLVEVGDVGVITVLASLNSGVTTSTTPAGWTKLASVSSSLFYVFYKVLVAADSGTTVSGTFDVSSYSSLTSVILSGIDSTNGIEVIGTTAFVSSGLTVTAPSVTTISPNDYLLAIGAVQASVTPTVPAGMSLLGNISGGSVSVATFGEQLGAAGATGTRTISFSGTASGYIFGVMLAFKPVKVPKIRGVGISGGSQVPWNAYLPRNVQNGDLLVAIINKTSAGNSPTETPAGWTLASTYGADPNPRIEFFTRIASSEPTYYVWPNGYSALASSYIMAIINGTPTFDGAGSSGGSSTTSITAPSFAVAGADLLLAFVATTQNVGSNSGGSIPGYTTLINVNANTSPGTTTSNTEGTQVVQSDIFYNASAAAGTLPAHSTAVTNGFNSIRIIAIPYGVGGNPLLVMIV